MRTLQKHLSAIISPDAGIEAGVYNQEKDQEKAGETHHQFLSYRRCEDLFPGHNAVLGFKFAANLTHEQMLPATFLQLPAGYVLLQTRRIIHSSIQFPNSIGSDYI
jgi:hypothetical protein